VPSLGAERIPTRRIAAFALRVGLIWAAFAAAWPLLAPVYRPLYCTMANLAFRNGEARAEFSVTRAPQGDHDVDILLTRRSQSGVEGEVQHSSRLSGYLPMITLVAFVLASPISWSRRRKALLVGLLFVGLYVLLRIWVPIWRDFSNPNALQVYDPGGFGRWLMGVLQRSVVDAPASWFVVPIFIWVGVAFRRTDWELLGGAGDADGAS